MRKCASSLSGYGWCGVLALKCAIGDPIPQSEKEFTDTLDTFRGIIKEKLPSWAPTNDAAKKKKRGSITNAQMMKVLGHYRDRCTATVDVQHTKMTVAMWLKKVASKTPNRRYIVRTGKHAMFVNVPKVASRWKLYDQAGPKTALNLPAMRVKGQVGGMRIQRIYAITDPE